jgi:hypothetical protein
MFRLTTAIVTGALALAPYVVASKLSAAPVASPTAKVDSGARQSVGKLTSQNQIAEKRQLLIREATTAIRQTQDALKALDTGKKAEALDDLASAAGKLEIILARQPSLSLAPAEMGVVTYDVIGDQSSIKATRSQAEKMIQEGRLQDARRLLRDFGSETDISISNIPLATYPEAIKAAAKFIDEDKVDDAKRTLQTALDTLVVTETVIPLPVNDAQVALSDAEKLAKKKDRNPSDNKKLANLLGRARTDLERTEALGYGAKKDFKVMYDEISDIEGKTQGGKSGTGFFASIKASISDLFNSAQPAQHR